MGYVYILGCISLTVYGQLIIKWRMSLKGPLPETMSSKLSFLVHAILYDPFLLSGLASALGAALFWMAAMTKYDVSSAYPLVSAGLVLFTSLGGVMLLSEQLTTQKILGIILIIAGVIVVGQEFEH